MLIENYFFQFLICSADGNRIVTGSVRRSILWLATAVVMSSSILEAVADGSVMSQTETWVRRHLTGTVQLFPVHGSSKLGVD